MLYIRIAKQHFNSENILVITVFIKPCILVQPLNLLNWLSFVNFCIFLTLVLMNMEFGHTVSNDTVDGKDKGTLCNSLYIWRHLAVGV